MGRLATSPHLLTANPWRMGDNLIAHILATLPAGATVLELGSGEGTALLACLYTMYSVEHDPAWIGKYDSHYIYAPLLSGWYCVRILEQQLPPMYDALIIDGPPGSRFAMARYLDIFDLGVPVFVDDVNRPEEYLLAQVIETKTGRPLQIFDELDGRQFAYVPAA